MAGSRLSLATPFSTGYFGYRVGFDGASVIVGSLFGYGNAATLFAAP